MKDEIVSIDDIQRDPRNTRRHGERNRDLIAQSLREVGPARSIAIDEKNVLMAGEGVTTAAKQIGITKVRIIDANADELIAVRRKNLTEEQKRRLSLFDNRAGELAEWDADALRAERDAGVFLDDLFTEDELANLIPDDPDEKVMQISIEKPTDVAWVLCAIPVTEWARYQAHVEALQGASLFTTMVLRKPEKP